MRVTERGEREMRGNREGREKEMRIKSKRESRRGNKEEGHVEVTEREAERETEREGEERERETMTIFY